MFVLHVASIILYFITCFSLEHSESAVDFAYLRCTQIRDMSSKIIFGIADTSNRAYSGGNTNWEHASLVDYEDSEVRFNDVISFACQGVSSAPLCYELVDRYEDEMLEWWKTDRKNKTDIYNILFVKTLKQCCPEGYFGPDCTECNGLVNGIPCNGHGTCEGDGSRLGEGICKCDAQHQGVECDKCAEDYYLSDEKCKRCSFACLKGCTGGESKDCLHQACTSGYNVSEEGGCEDINECLITDKCSPNTFCINNDGSYMCEKCDEACKGCNFIGADKCKECAEGYVEKEGSCVIDEALVEQNSEITCDKACKGCTDTGADKCKECADGFTIDEGVCTAVENSFGEDDLASETEKKDTKRKKDESGKSKDKKKSNKDHDHKDKKKDKKKSKDDDDRKEKKKKKSKKNKDDDTSVEL